MQYEFWMETDLHLYVQCVPCLVRDSLLVLQWRLGCQRPPGLLLLLLLLPLRRHLCPVGFEARSLLLLLPPSLSLMKCRNGRALSSFFYLFR